MANYPTFEAPCKKACPINIDIPRYIRAIGNGNFDEALDVIREKLPFPSICGRICFHPCEYVCNCRSLSEGEALAIRALKRFVAENAKGTELISQVKEQTHKRIAIIGSGPAGLTAAFFLRRLGHDVTVFEKMPEPGGMLRYAIPEYRLPKNIISKEINDIKNMGVIIETSYNINDPTELLLKGWHAIFIAIGTHKGIALGIGDNKIPRIYDCIQLLREMSVGNKLKVGKSVAVIGGGNAAIDAARSLIRIGAKNITIIYRRSKEEMPASEEEVKDAIIEGVKFEYQAIPTKIVVEKGMIKLHLSRTELQLIDPAERKRPIPIPGSEYNIAVDSVIRAIGQVPDYPDGFNCITTERGLIKANQNTLVTNIKGVFAGGDVVSGSATFIDAIAAGRKAASNIDKYLGGTGCIDISIANKEVKIVRTLNQGIPIGKRIPIPSLSVEQRLIDGSLSVDSGYSKEQAVHEAERCLRCDLPIKINPNNCTGCMTCVMRCSLKHEKCFSPNAAQLIVVPFSDEKVNEISFKQECDGCGICARYCPHDALYRGDIKSAETF